MFLSANPIIFTVETEDVPAGWASVPVILDDNGHITNAIMVAGSIGMQVSSSGKELHSGNGEVGIDTIQPLSGWWMYESSRYLRLLRSLILKELKTNPLSSE